MSDYNLTLPASAHLSAKIKEPPEVYALDDDRYAIHFGFGLSIHCSRSQWDRFDTAVRAGMRVAA